MVENREERALDKVSTEDTYRTIRGYVIDAQRQVYSAVNSAMVLAYHEIGEQIYRACGENDRAEYGKNLLQYLSEHLTAEFGQGYTVRNLQMMRKFYLTFPNANTLCSELSWSHYRMRLTVRRIFLFLPLPAPGG